jgi:hypothetical protein
VILMQKQLTTANRKLSTISASYELSSNIWKQQFSALLLRCVQGQRLTQAEYEVAKRFAKMGPNIQVESASGSGPATVTSSPNRTVSNAGNAGNAGNASTAASRSFDANNVSSAGTTVPTAQSNNKTAEMNPTVPAPPPPGPNSMYPTLSAPRRYEGRQGIDTESPQYSQPPLSFGLGPPSVATSIGSRYASSLLNTNNFGSVSSDYESGRFSAGTPIETRQSGVNNFSSNALVASGGPYQPYFNNNTGEVRSSRTLLSPR